MKIWSLAAIVALGTSGLATAQDPLDELYGRAVHTYFRGDSYTAESMLNEVVEAGSQDPRVYFFRGLASWRNGNLDSATADFQHGAKLEISGKKVVNVGRSLERIQGPSRVELEKARTQARLESRNKVLELDRARYDALQKQGGVADGGLVVPPSRGGVRPAPLAPNDPFVNGMTQGEPVPVENSGRATKPETVDPLTPADEQGEAFGGLEAEGTESGMGDSPFGSGAAEPAGGGDPFDF